MSMVVAGCRDLASRMTVDNCHGQTDMLKRQTALYTDGEAVIMLAFHECEQAAGVRLPFGVRSFFICLVAYKFCHTSQLSRVAKYTSPPVCYQFLTDPTRPPRYRYGKLPSDSHMTVSRDVRGAFSAPAQIGSMFEFFTLYLISLSIVGVL